MYLKSLGLVIALFLGTAAIAQPDNDHGVPKQITDLQQQLASMQAQVTALSSQVGTLQNSLVTQAQVTALSSKVDVLQNSLATQGSMIWVTADCNNGGSIATALQSAGGHAGPLGVLVLGVCHESVYIDRSNTMISGGTPDAAISPPASNNTEALGISNAVNVTIANLALTGASGNALNISQSQVTVSNVIISTASMGIFETGGSSVTMSQATIENIGGVAIQVWGSHMDMYGGGIQNNTTGIQVVNGASMSLLQGALITNNQGPGVLLSDTSTLSIGEATIQYNSKDGIQIADGSSLVMGWAGNPATIQYNGGNGIILMDTSVARFNGIGAAVITGNTGGGIVCASAHGAPAAQITGQGPDPSNNFVITGNGAPQIGCPANF